MVTPFNAPGFERTVELRVAAAVSDPGHVPIGPAACNDDLMV
jgi:hypothetical protein